MFERFTTDARNAVTGAQHVSRELGDRHIGTEHVLLALLEGSGPAARALSGRGVDAAGLRVHLARTRGRGGDPLDPAALKAIGIDLEAVREAAEDSFGEGALDTPAGSRPGRKGHTPFTPDAKKSLELSLRHALRLKHRHIGSGHVLLGLLHDPGFLSVRLLAEAGVDVAGLRADVTRLTTANAA
ncbi:Clp protease N-terminal domain-containing protein [Actinomadura xylanilytica]|uniref:Clp protease N-terminal domain-containing protein n=1 Tax=Actinomadura xylanilytica TaxID=887459 RepID=UPI00255A7C90|nr:Clp protease N-terminal domain-containing protein [Actinomadura xylanilytica]MDL4770860.1 Clp protease N-terminal domain-containing protein [Actinomadura xylanilytica]